MTKLLLNIFVKNNNNVSDIMVRQKYGTLSGGIGILINVILFILKFSAGVLTSSISVTADAFNNLSDAGSSIVTLIGFKISGKPADSDHPYGHGRAEYITALIIAFVIVIMGFELLKSSVEKIINPEIINFTSTSFFILVISIAAKLWLALFNKNLGKRINSSALSATATDSLNDSIATTIVLISLLTVYFFGINIDGYAGVIVALFVLYSGYDTAKDTLQPLLGRAPNPEFVKALEDCILSNTKISGIHDMIVHDYGPGRVIVSLHAEIPCDMNLLEAHDIIDNAELIVKSKFKCEISIHMDPIATNDKFTNELKKKVLDIINTIDPCLGLHDFRITNGPLRTNIIFDIEIPFNFKYTDKEVVKTTANKIKELSDKYYPVIHVDKK